MGKEWFQLPLIPGYFDTQQGITKGEVCRNHKWRQAGSEPWEAVSTYREPCQRLPPMSGSWWHWHPLPLLYYRGVQKVWDVYTIPWEYTSQLNLSLLHSFIMTLLSDNSWLRSCFGGEDRSIREGAAPSLSQHPILGTSSWAADSTPHKGACAGTEKSGWVAAARQSSASRGGLAPEHSLGGEYRGPLTVGGTDQSQKPHQRDLLPHLLEPLGLSWGAFGHNEHTPQVWVHLCFWKASFTSKVEWTVDKVKSVFERRDRISLD